MQSEDLVVTMPDYMRLKTRLKLKYLMKRIDEEVEENFGYSPSTEYFDSLLIQENYWESLAKKYYPDIYEEHEDKRYE